MKVNFYGLVKTKRDFENLTSLLALYAFIYYSYNKFQFIKPNIGKMLYLYQVKYNLQYEQKLDWEMNNITPYFGTFVFWVLEKLSTLNKS